jgi:hypothetical protein
MKKPLLVAAAVLAVVALGRRAGGKAESLDWEQLFERMPDNAPPKWMFRNINAIRENTERILDLVQREQAEEARALESTVTL